MRFPGNRNSRHYFPVTKSASRADPRHEQRRWYIVGLDEVIVDIEVTGPAEVAAELGLIPGESIQLPDEKYLRLLARLDAEGLPRRYAAGGTVANTLNNFTFLSGEPAVLLGAMPESIRLGEPGFAYVAQTPKGVDLSYVQPRAGPIGTAITFITPDGERAFGVAPGIAAQFGPEAVPDEVITNAAVVLASLYSLRSEEWPLAKAVRRAMSLAKEAEVPVAFGLGTASLVREKRSQVRDLLAELVTVAAMNALEAEALTGVPDVLLSGQMILDWVDLVIITEGADGLTIGGWTDERVKRQTREQIRTKSIAEYNRWEYSRLMRRSDCERPLKVFSHIHPYRGGPARLTNTSGAGDAALAAILHDITANQYHRATVPGSDKHAAPVSFLTYSSLSRNAQYGNRVAYEVLRGHSPRLDGSVGSDDGLDEQADESGYTQYSFGFG